MHDLLVSTCNPERLCPADLQAAYKAVEMQTVQIVLDYEPDRLLNGQAEHLCTSSVIYTIKTLQMLFIGIKQMPLDRFNITLARIAKKKGPGNSRPRIHNMLNFIK